ncbi:sialidase family protein [Maribellus sp. YY47]|uniref:sialidase family protein n=1 Tax=Maribellus sp. YY47 TaxID=2929486 RepID=UPI00200166CC|nr:sialidase family protein [Maribellus sp. YY47]MCK3684391.1 glycoside hydrolase [Maribellus sp. YY47]
MKILIPFALLIIMAASCKVNSGLEKNAILVKEIWSQADSSYKNFRIPSLIVTKNNTLLAFAEGREGGDTGNIDLLLKRSTDNGQTWESQTVVWDDGNNTCGNPCPVIDQSTGRIILFMTWNLGSDHESDIIRKQSEDTRVPYMTYSDDDGLTWATPRNMLETCKDTSWGWYATGPGIGIQLTSGKYKGRLVIPCNNSYDDPDSKKLDGFNYGCHVLLSDDGGTTWRMSEPITPLVNESQVVELSDGTLLMNMRSYHEKAYRAVSISTDGGETWSEIQHAAQLTEPVCQASLFHFGKYKGKEMYLFSNPAVPFSRTNMTIKTSFDDCSSWSNSKLIYQGPSAYSCLTRLPNGNVGLFFECGEKNPYEKMLFVSFDPKELFTPGSVLANFIKE